MDRCECGDRATMLIIHKCAGKNTLQCTGARATCDTHLAADIRGELEIAVQHAGGVGTRVVQVRRARAD